MLALAAAPLAAQKPIQLALFPPIQIVPEGQAVKGLRIDFIYGKNTTMTGLELGLVNQSTGSGSSGGVHWGLVSMVKGSFTGWQGNLINSTEGRFVGFQSGAVSLTHDFEGLQWSVVNSSWNASGLQLGLINYARHTTGFQVGLVNIIKSGGQFPVMVIVNWGKR